MVSQHMIVFLHSRMANLHMLHQQRDSLDCVAEKVVDRGQFYEEVALEEARGTDSLTSH